ncbi:MAG: hypothetical protein ACLGHN_03905 [Bacteriovoracia bacterium]
MDEIELLVEETFRHFQENFPQMEGEKDVKGPVTFNEENDSYPENPGVIYHIQKSSSVFVLRTIVSANIRQDFLRIIERPEDFPSLRLLEGGAEDLAEKLKFFIVENPSEAEIIHDQLHNRRFPVHEELMCNLSDPGFSWWLTKKPKGFQVSFTMSVAQDQNTIKLGPLGDREFAIRNFQTFESLVTSAGIEMNVQNELNRVQFTDCEEFLLEELKDVFEFGVITQTLKDLFKILARKINDPSSLEESWFYIHELAAMRRFWIQIQYDLNAE